MQQNARQQPTISSEFIVIAPEIQSFYAPSSLPHARTSQKNRCPIARYATIPCYPALLNNQSNQRRWQGISNAIWNTVQFTGSDLSAGGSGHGQAGRERIDRNYSLDGLNIQGDVAAAISNLTPGDFRIVRDTFSIMPADRITPQAMIDDLRRESLIKQVYRGDKSIGFMH